MNEQATHTKSRSISLDRRWFIVGAGVIAAALVILTYTDRSRIDTVSLPSQPVAPTNNAQAMEQRIIAEAEIARKGELAQRQLAARMKLKTLERQLNDGLALVGELENEIKSWTQHVLPLLDNEPGMRLAKRREYVQAFAVLLNKERATNDTAKSFRSWFIDARERVTEAINSGSTVTPQDSLSTDISDVTQRARAARDAYRDERRTIEGLLANAKQDNVDTIGDKTLREAMQLYDRAYAEERAGRLAEQRDRFERDLTNRLVAVEKDHLERMANLATQSTRQRLDDERRKAQIEAKLAKERAEQNRLETLATSPEVQRRFAAFLEDGTLGMFRELKPPAPLSYVRLKEYGVIENFDRFAEIRSNPTSNRTTLPYPKTKQKLAKWREDWELFKQLAPLWRDTGKLAP